MKAKFDLKKIERNTYLIYHQDGLWDIFVGLIFLGYGICVAYGFTSIAVIIPATLAAFIPNLIFLKKKFTQPRLGYVVPGPERKNKEARKKRLLVVVGIFSFLAGVVNFLAFTVDSAWITWIKDLELIPFGAVLSLIALSIAIIYFIKRFIVYAIIILATFVIGHLMEIVFPAYFIFLGVVFLVVGLYYLVNFIKKYPLASREELNSVG